MYVYSLLILHFEMVSVASCNLYGYGCVICEFRDEKRNALSLIGEMFYCSACANPIGINIMLVNVKGKNSVILRRIFTFAFSCM